MHIFNDLFILCVWIIFVCMYECVPCVLGTGGSQRGMLHPLELKLKMIVNPIWVLAVQPRSSARAMDALDLWAITPASMHILNQLNNYDKQSRFGITAVLLQNSSQVHFWGLGLLFGGCCCSSRGPEFSSRHPNGPSQLCVALVLRTSHTLLGDTMHGGILTHLKKNIHTCKIKQWLISFEIRKEIC